MIEMGDFAGGFLKYLRRHPVPRVTIAGGFAKMTKLGQGMLDLHSKRGSVDLVWLAARGARRRRHRRDRRPHREGQHGRRGAGTGRERRHRPRRHRGRGGAADGGGGARRGRRHARGRRLLERGRAGGEGLRSIGWYRSVGIGWIFVGPLSGNRSNEQTYEIRREWLQADRLASSERRKLPFRNGLIVLARRRCNMGRKLTSIQKVLVSYDPAVHLSSAAAAAAPTTDIAVPLDVLSGKPGGTVTIRPGITTLVGPNGSGKTRALRSIQQAIRNRGAEAANVRFLPAGRTSPIERFRAAIDSPGVGSTSGEAYYGDVSYRSSWHQIESVVGDLINLDHRPDLRIKVETRLQQLFDRGIDFQWGQRGLGVSFTAMSGNARYHSGLEASGITQLVSLLSAIYDDTIGTLIVDEPEISLHPQLQAFIFEEMESVAGDWGHKGKKRIVVSTHSPSFLPLRSLANLPSIVFFGGDADCRQIDPANGLLQSSKLAQFVVRTSLSHRQALFAERILLVEGPSDEIVAAWTARRLGMKIEARNTQILPALGKGEFREARKLFTEIGIRVTVLADLDALVDDNILVNDFSSADGARTIANRERSLFAHRPRRQAAVRTRGADRDERRRN